MSPKGSPFNVSSDHVPTVRASGTVKLLPTSTKMLAEIEIDASLVYQAMANIIDRGNADGDSSVLVMGAAEEGHVNVGLTFTTRTVQVWANNNDASTPTIKWALVGLPI